MSDDMNEKEMINNLIDNYTSLQRIKKAENSEKEIEDLQKAAWYINKEIQRLQGDKS